MSFRILHKFEHNGKTYKFVPDDQHETIGSYAYATPEETKAAEDHELAMLESGDWIALGCIVEEKCDGVLPIELEGAPRAGLHCPCCLAHGGKLEVDSFWGIILDNSTTAWEQFIRDGGM